MSIYYVNDNPQPGGEHEVHEYGCAWLNMAVSTTCLGACDNCQEAINAARSYYSNVDGCKHCVEECHTR